MRTCAVSRSWYSIKRPRRDARLSWPNRFGRTAQLACVFKCIEIKWKFTFCAVSWCSSVRTWTWTRRPRHWQWMVATVTTWPYRPPPGTAAWPPSRFYWRLIHMHWRRTSCGASGRSFSPTSRRSSLPISYAIQYFIIPAAELFSASFRIREMP